MPNLTPKVEVVQADEDQAKSALDALGLDHAIWMNADFVQAFARHRIAHQPSPITGDISDRAREMLAKVRMLFPISVHETPDYAELSFGDGHPTQAMTMDPQTWLALDELFAALNPETHNVE